MSFFRGNSLTRMYRVAGLKCLTLILYKGLVLIDVKEV